MRQIKFRGLRTDGKSFAFGLLRKQRQRDTSQSGNGVAYTGDWEYWIDSHEGEQGSWLVIPESIGQFTGLHDKNGVEIYDGDRVRHNDNIFVVKYSENQHVLLLRVENDKGMNWRSLQWLAKVAKYCEVIGNTHTQDGGQEG